MATVGSYWPSDGLPPKFVILLFWSFLLFMGLIYNVPPIRSKERPYLDVLSESINNPIRLLLGWFVVTERELPPASLVVIY